MNYNPTEISSRITKLKEAYRNLPVPQAEQIYDEGKYKIFCTGDRWLTLGYLRGWRDNANALTEKLRGSLSEAAEFKWQKPVILDNELLLGHLYLPEYTEEERLEYDELCAAFEMSVHTKYRKLPRKDHFALDYEKLIRVGLNGLRREIRERLSEIDLARCELYPSTDTLSKCEFYECLLIELDAVSDLARRYADAARKMSENVGEPRRSELLKMADVISKVPDEPAASFYEAVMSVHFFLSTLFGLYPLGRPDRYLSELYEKDINSGLITREFAQELIDNLCLGISDRVFSRAACGFIVGGEGDGGETVENELTYMFLTALDHLQLPDPNGALAVNERTSDEILEYSAKILSKGTTHPAFFGDGTIIDSLVNNYGCERRDAVNYIHSTCAEISIAGKSKSHTTPFFVYLPESLAEAVEECGKYNKIEDIVDILYDKMRQKLSADARKYLFRMMDAGRYGCDSLRAHALVDNCIERGKSLFEGGEKYTFIAPVFIGFATAVDSIAAIDILVGKEAKLTLKEFSEAVKNDFQGCEELKEYIVHKLPHYGNNESLTDGIAKMLYERIESVIRDEKIPEAKYMMPGTFTYVFHANVGAGMGATFDGRRAHTSLSDGCSPVQGRDTHGPTAMINSLTSFDQSRFLGGMVVNVKFGKKSFDGEKAKKLVALLRAFIKRGGIEMQVNAVDRKTLLDAKKNPDAHRDLTVRIGGYSDYFVRLDGVLQDEIIERTEY